MRKGGGRAKGSAFERDIAHRVVRAFAKLGIEKKDCYRTPLSGGHRQARECDPGDLVISPKLRKMFPFSVECKAYREVKLWPLLIAVEDQKKSWKFRGWLDQTCAAAARQEEQGEELHPLLVFKGNNTPVLCAFPALYPLTFSFRNVYRFYYKDEKWYVVLFDDFLKKAAHQAVGIQRGHES